MFGYSAVMNPTGEEKNVGYLTQLFMKLCLIFTFWATGVSFCHLQSSNRVFWCCKTNKMSWYNNIFAGNKCSSCSFRYAALISIVFKSVTLTCKVWCRISSEVLFQKDWETRQQWFYFAHFEVWTSLLLKKWMLLHRHFKQTDSVCTAVLYIAAS